MEEVCQILIHMITGRFTYKIQTDTIKYYTISNTLISMDVYVYVIYSSADKKIEHLG